MAILFISTALASEQMKQGSSQSNKQSLDAALKTAERSYKANERAVVVKVLEPYKREDVTRVQYLLAWAYAGDIPVHMPAASDAVQALTLALSAARKGYAPAEVLVAGFYAVGLGRGNHDDQWQALKWYCKAANSDLDSGIDSEQRAFIGFARRVLSEKQTMGRSDPGPRWVGAYVWRTLAEEADPKADASAAFDQFEKIMTPEQISSAKRLAASWRPGQPVAPCDALENEGMPRSGETATAVTDSTASAIDRIRGVQHSPMPRAERVDIGNVGIGQGMTIMNSTSYTIRVYFRGPVSRSVTILPKQSANVELTPGQYEEAAEAVNSNVIPFYGEHSQESGAVYRVSFYIGSR